MEFNVLSVFKGIEKEPINPFNPNEVYRLGIRVFAWVLLINRNFYFEIDFDFPHTAIKLLRRLGVSGTFFHGI